MKKRYVWTIGMLVGSVACAQVLAQPYPSKTIRLIVPAPPGGGNDTIAREISQHMSGSMGQQVVVDNRPGASMMIAGGLAAKSAPDGYTIFMGNNSVLSINPGLFSKLPYDAVKDFAPITMLASAPFVLLLHPSVPAKNVKELIALAKARPGQLNFASSGTGIANHLAGEMLKTMAKINMVHVPYKGAGPALIETIAGQVEMFFTSVPSGLPHVKTGRLRALGVTGAKRSAALPEVPTFQEAGPELAGYEVSAWYGMVAPAATPREIINKLNAEMVRILEIPRVRERFANDGAEIIGNTPEEFGRVIRNDIEKWKRVIKETGIKVDVPT